MLHQKRIGLISAVPFESSELLRSLSHKKKSPRGLTEGNIDNRKVVHITSGIGIANASHAATLLINKYPLSLVVNFGIGGAYPKSGLKIGDVAFAEKEIYADAGVLMKDGLRDLETIGIPLLQKGQKKYYNEFPVNRRLLNVFREDLPGVLSGVFLTVSQSTGTLKRARELRKIYNASCENMEGAAVAHVCMIYGIPFIELRGISNIVENRDIKKWDTTTASVNCQLALIKIIKGF